MLMLQIVCFAPEHRYAKIISLSKLGPVRSGPVEHSSVDQFVSTTDGEHPLPFAVAAAAATAVDQQYS